METLENQIKELNAEIMVLKDQNKEFKDDLQKVKQKNMSLDREIKNLKDELDDVKVEQRTLTKNQLISATERQTLQVDVCVLKKSNSSLQKSNSSLQKSISSLQKSNSSLQKSISSLQKSISSLQKSISSLQKSNSSLQKSISSLQKSISSLQKKVQKLEIDNTTLKRKVEDLERKVKGLERKIHVPDDDLILGELCRRVQCMIFQKILPQDVYDDKESYKIKKMDESLWLLFKDDECKINAANQAWTELQKKLKWQEEDFDFFGSVMKKFQQGRNVVAHPELTEDILTETTQRMKDAGRLVGFRTPENFMEIVSVWKQLKMMA